MTKVRVYELAKELNISSKELIEKIEDLNIEVNSHMSSISSEEAELIKELLTEVPEVVTSESETELLDEIIEEEIINTSKKNKKKKEKINHPAIEQVKSKVNSKYDNK